VDLARHGYAIALKRPVVLEKKGVPHREIQELRLDRPPV
jgi:hypothetical protein